MWCREKKWINKTGIFIEEQQLQKVTTNTATAAVPADRGGEKNEYEEDHLMALHTIVVEIFALILILTHLKAENEWEKWSKHQRAKNKEQGARGLWIDEEKRALHLLEGQVAFYIIISHPSERKQSASRTQNTHTFTHTYIRACTTKAPTKNKTTITVCIYLLPIRTYIYYTITHFIIILRRIIVIIITQKSQKNCLRGTQYIYNRPTLLGYT